MLQLPDADLKAYAAHIQYEVVTLVEQATHRQLWLATDEFVRRALLEATLVHVRLLDEFHRKTPREKRDDVIAVHYLPTWVPRPILSGRDLEQVNAQLAHLAFRRQSGYQWRLGQLAVDASRVFVEFVDQLRKAQPNRAGWFDHAHRTAKDMVAQAPFLFVGTGKVPLSTPMTTTTTAPGPPVR